MGGGGGSKHTAHEKHVRWPQTELLKLQKNVTEKSTGKFIEGY